MFKLVLTVLSLVLLHYSGRLPEWYRAVGYLWSVGITWRLYLGRVPSPEAPILVPLRNWDADDSEGYPSPRSVCRKILETGWQGPGWPLLGKQGVFRIATDYDLCRALVDLERSFRVYVYTLPRTLSNSKKPCSMLNRALNTEAEVVRQLRHGPLTTTDPDRAQLFVNPVTTCRREARGPTVGSKLFRG